MYAHGSLKFYFYFCYLGKKTFSKAIHDGLIQFTEHTENNNTCDMHDVAEQMHTYLEKY